MPADRIDASSAGSTHVSPAPVSSNARTRTGGGITRPARRNARTSSAHNPISASTSGPAGVVATVNVGIRSVRWRVLGCRDAEALAVPAVKRLGQKWVEPVGLTAGLMGVRERIPDRQGVAADEYETPLMPLLDQFGQLRQIERNRRA